MQVLARRFYHIPSDPTCVGLQPSIAAMCAHTPSDQRSGRPASPVRSPGRFSVRVEPDPPSSAPGAASTTREPSVRISKARARSLRTSRRLRNRSGRTGCGQPGDPCRPASQAPPTEERNRLAAPHGGRMTVVPILEWWRRLARERGKEVASCLPANPFCRRRHTGHARLVWIKAPELATQGVSSALCQGAAISTPSAPPPITAKESRAARFAGSVSRSAESTASRIRRRSSNASDCLCSTLRLSAPKPCPCCGLLHGQATHAWGSAGAMHHHAGSSRLIPGWVYRSSMRKMQPWSVSERMSRPAA